MIQNYVLSDMYVPMSCLQISERDSTRTYPTMLFTVEMSYNFNFKCSFIHARKISTGFPVQIITELTNADVAVR